jgi:hypothetical protein
MTQAQTFVSWAQNNTDYTDAPDEVIHEYSYQHGVTISEKYSDDTGQERRWDREMETVYEFPDASLVLARWWSPLQWDHADGIEPDPSWFVAESYTAQVIKYRVVV